MVVDVIAGVGWGWEGCDNIQVCWCRERRELAQQSRRCGHHPVDFAFARAAVQTHMTMFRHSHTLMNVREFKYSN